MTHIEVSVQDGIALLTLNRGVTNAVNLEMALELGETLGVLKDDRQVSAIVVRSANDKFFMIGWDIPELLALSRDEFVHFYRTFCQVSVDLYTMPKPTVAAITGHATAGGCILAFCCDFRYIAEGRTLMGLNEVKLGVPLPYPADCIVRSLTSDRAAREIVEMGEFHGPEQMQRFGLVDDVVAPDEVLPRAIERAAALGAQPAQGLARIKEDRVERVIAQIDANRDEKEKSFLDCWLSDEAQARIRGAAEKF